MTDLRTSDLTVDRLRRDILAAVPGDDGVKRVLVRAVVLDGLLDDLKALGAAVEDAGETDPFGG